GFAACEGNRLDPEPVIESPLVALNYDGPVETAPNLPGGEYEAAARFDASDMATYDGGKWVEVYFYLFSRPGSATLKIYKGTGINGPEEVVYSAAISSNLEGNSWNRHVLSTPVDIESDDYWIAVKFSTVNTAQIIGCDPGPAHPDGDWLFRGGTNTWETFRAIANGESINWNIRGVIEP
ncbi:MAG: hypothetical protein AAFP02_16645, partial [Bacteroidota bacterium]